MEINISRKRIERAQRASEKRIRELSLGWWNEIELISELFGFVEPIGGNSFGSAVAVLTTGVNSPIYQSYLFFSKPVIMYPAYYPHHTNPIHYATSNDPRAKEIDRGTLNLPYHPFPYASNHCYPIPQPCHPCCNHSYFGGPYTFTSPYPHYPPPPPPPYPTHGFYPGAHLGYSFPPPHSSIEQPRYDYDKNTRTPHHCSSCEKKSNIEQEESKVDKKTTTDSLVPFLKDYPYPVVWVPPNYMNTEPNTKEKDNHPRVHVSKPLEQTLKQGGNDEIAQGQQGEVDKRFPFPIFWLPSNEVKKDIKGDKDNVDENTRNDSEVESEQTSSIKHGVQKVIPVKQLETKEEKKSENDKEKKVTEKTSKLPPVCLRIDPLPKKKNTSRSPSPPGEKERSKRSTIEDSKPFKQQTELPESVKNDEKKAEKDSVVDSCSGKVVGHDRLSEVEGLKMEKKKRSLSENEAAVMIQSVYRGFEVRKSQPLMKLRKIAQVGKQVVELRNRIQDLELSSSAINDKQKLIIGEIIMSLLLKLDTIQGLHPIVRDIRKSVAKELVGLQEKLDSLTSVKTSEETTCSTDRVEDDAIHEKSDESQPKSDSNAKHVENREVEATESQYDDDDAQVELQNEENINDNQIPTLVEPEQTAHDSIGHEKAQSDSNDGSVRLDLVNHEFEATDPMKTEQLVEEFTGEVNEEQVQVAVETDQRPETSEQPQSESGTSFEAMESDQTQALIFKDVDLIEDLTATTVEVEKDVTTAETTESGKEDEAIEDQVPIVSAEEAPTVVDVDLATATAETRELGEEDEAIGVQEPDVSTEEAPTVEVDDLTTATVEVEKDVSAAETTELRKEDEAIGVKDESIVANEAAPVVDEVDGGSMEEVGGDRRLMDENEKLRAAVEELMKAGNEQVSVIRELTGRVKDLEKKLSKKKTRKLKKCRGSRASVVEEELRSCVV